MAPKVEQITEPVVLGEGPHWDADQQALFFVSIHEGTIHKYVLATGEHTQTKLNGRVGFIVPVEGTTDQFVVGVERKFLVVKWDGKNNSKATVVKELFEIDEDTPKNRINDGKADPRGRLYAGTMGHEEPLGTFVPKQGSLFRLDGGNNIEKLDSGIEVSNGLAWDLKAKAMYYVDSLEDNVRRYDYDVETGKISNKTYIFDLAEHGLTGKGDGVTIDTDGNLWLAVFGSSCILNINPKTGKLIQKIDFPAKQVSSATFGGPNYDILFVTTAKLNQGGEQKYPSGAVFKVTGLGVTGLPNVNFKL